MTSPESYYPGIRALVARYRDFNFSDYEDRWISMSRTMRHYPCKTLVYAMLNANLDWRSALNAFQFLVSIKKQWDNYSATVECLRRSRCGMYELKARSVVSIRNLFVRGHNPLNVWGIAGTRNWLARNVYGLGLVKTSFAYEMLHPTRSTVFCFDRHMFDAMGIPRNLMGSSTFYPQLEKMWMSAAREAGIKYPVLLRHKVWDDRMSEVNNEEYNFELWARPMVRMLRV